MNVLDSSSTTKSVGSRVNIVKSLTTTNSVSSHVNVLDRFITPNGVMWTVWKAIVQQIVSAVM